MEQKPNRGRAVFARILALLGSVIVIATALFHASGYTAVAAVVDRAELGEFLGSGFKGLWLMFSANLILLASVSLLFTIRITGSSRSVLVVCGTILTANTLILFAYLGMFIGAQMLAAGSGAVLAASALMESPRKSDAG